MPDLIARALASKAYNLANTSGYITVKSIGCVGDGVTDDTDKFQEAINTAILQGKTLYINVGTYLITERLTIPESLYILGGNHSTSIIKFRGIYHTETAYDLTWYEESNACFRIIGNNVKLENFTINGGDDKYSASQSNGIIFHYTKPNGTQYDAAQRCEITNVDIECFKNGVFIYAGWNRYFLLCHFINCSNAGIKWYPLELNSVGAWADSGDIVMGCQFVGNLVAGIYAQNAFQTTIWQGVFEYNDKAVHLVDCRDIIIKNCWNEANTNNSYVKGNAKFEGGYNFGVNTVNHELTGGSDIIVFESETSTIIKSGSTTKFNQQAGIITKGVEINTEVDNMISNPYFTEASGGLNYIPSTTGWSLYPSGSIFTVDETNTYNDHNSLHYLVTTLTNDAGYQANPDAITIEAGKKYSVSVQCKTPDRATIDGKLMLYVAWKNGAGEVIQFNNTELTMIGDNTWEEKTVSLTSPSTAASVILGFGCSRNGNVYFSEPSFSISDALIRNNVFLRQSELGKLQVYDISGVLLGKLTLEV